MSINYPTLVNFSHFRHLRSIWFHSIITYFQIHSILTNKANFRNDKMNITSFTTSIYKIFLRWRGQKTKPKQTQLKPIQTQFNPKQTQFKANQTQFERPISDAFGCHRNIYYILSNELWRFLRGISILLGGES